MATEEERETLVAKQLEWDNYVEPPFVAYARTPFGVYQVHRGHIRGSGWWWFFSGSMGNEGHGSEEEAKVAAQIDFERRVRSALADPDQSATISRLTAEVGRLREAALDSLASLVATTSLLQRAAALKHFQNVKLAAPSDKMFDQMLLDYETSIERARSALANTAEEGRG